MTTTTQETTVLTESERASVAHHCRVAAERYEENVKQLREDDHARNPHSGIHRLIETFQAQARQARELADRVEYDEAVTR